MKPWAIWINFNIKPALSKGIRPDDGQRSCQPNCCSLLGNVLLIGNLTREIRDPRWLYVICHSNLSKYTVVLSKLPAVWGKLIFLSVVQNWWGDLPTALSSSQNKKDIKQMSGPQKAHRALKLFKVLEHCSYKEKLRVWGWLSWEKRRLKGIFSAYIILWWEGMKMSNCSQ